MPQDAATTMMTYAELAARLSIKPESAKRLAQRRKWHRVIGNDGIALVHVPEAAVRRNIPDDVTPDATPDVAPDAPPLVISPVTPDLAPRVAYLEGIVEGIRGQLEAEQRRADAAEARIVDITADREAWKLQAQLSIWSRLFGKSNK
ncbi:hypothetical protein [Paracoccus marcusii]|uniref:hypothetical protein n=1 Tax=Paracoccus marcusii TaxID=59779 RepID=UPI003262D41C